MSKFRQQHMAVNWHTLVGDEGEITPIVNASLHDKASLVGRMGYLLLSVGASAFRVRSVMNKLSRSMDIICNADIGLTNINYTCVDGEEYITGTLALPSTGVNTDKINAYESFADGFSDRCGKYSAEQFHRILDHISQMPENYKPWQLGIASGAACCAFTFLLEGGPAEMIAAFFGAGIGNFVRKYMLKNKITLVGNVSVSVAVACIVYVAVMYLIQLITGVKHEAGYICSMLFIIPGFPLITGGIDLVKLDLRSGIERLIYAGIIIVTATITGWVMASVFSVSPGDLPQPELHPAIGILLKLIASFVGVFGFSMMFNSPPKVAATAAVIGMLVNTIRLELIEFTPLPVAVAAFIGAFLSGIIASSIKKRIGFSRVSITVPSVVIMVPGMFLYKLMYYVGQNNAAEGLFWLSRAFMILFALPVGLACARILTDINYRKNS